MCESVCSVPLSVSFLVELSLLEGFEIMLSFLSLFLTVSVIHIFG